MDVCQAVITANLGGIDSFGKHCSQNVGFDDIKITEDILPPRLGLTPRLQAKIPKCFAWQLYPKYDYYLWLDGNITLANPTALEYFQEQIQDHDIVVLRHPDRPNIRQEVRYTRKGVNQQSRYMVNRYTGEQYEEFYKLVRKDKKYIDDLLVIGGVFMYRNTPEVQAMFKEWWYYITRYCIQDQISFPYVLKKSGLRIKVLEHDFANWNYIKITRHKLRDI